MVVQCVATFSFIFLFRCKKYHIEDNTCSFVFHIMAFSKIGDVCSQVMCVLETLCCFCTLFLISESLTLVAFLTCHAREGLAFGVGVDCITGSYIMEFRR